MYKVKANWLLDKVSPWNYENDHGQESNALEGFSLTKLKDCLTQIKVITITKHVPLYAAMQVYSLPVHEASTFCHPLEYLDSN